MVSRFRLRLLLSAGLLLLAAGVLWTFGLPRLLPRLLYLPRPLVEAEANPRQWGVENAEVLHITTADNVRLYGWWLSHRPGQVPRCGTAILFYGNKGNLISRRQDAQLLIRLGLDVVLFDYRGYGASEGTPSESGLYADGEAVYQYVQRRASSPHRTVLIGHSLGSAVATYVAADQRAAGLILVAPFTSLPGAARARFSFLASLMPLGVDNRFDSRQRITRVRMPILMVLGTRDRIIHAGDVRVLFAAAPEPKTLVEVTGAGHNDIFDYEAFRDSIERFLQTAVQCEPGRS